MSDHEQALGSFLFGEHSVANIKTKTNWEYTSKAVTNEFRAHLNPFKRVFGYKDNPDTAEVEIPALQITIMDVLDTQISVRKLLTLAKDGKEVNGTQWYLNPEMSEQLDLLFRSLGSVGIDVHDTTTITLEGLQKWRDLAQVSPIIQEIIYAIDDAAVTGHRTLQSLIEMDYVRTGNQVMSDQMETMEEALGSTKEVLDSLNTLQNLHNELNVVGKGKDPLGDYKGASQDLINANIIDFYETPINPVIDVNIEESITKLIKDSQILAQEASAIVNGTGNDLQDPQVRFVDADGGYLNIFGGRKYGINLYLYGRRGWNLSSSLEYAWLNETSSNINGGNSIHGTSQMDEFPEENLFFYADYQNSPGGPREGKSTGSVSGSMFAGPGQYNLLKVSNGWESDAGHTNEFHSFATLYNGMATWGPKLNEYLTKANIHNNSIESLKQQLPDLPIDLDKLLLPTFSRISDDIIPSAGAPGRGLSHDINTPSEGDDHQVALNYRWDEKDSTKVKNKVLKPLKEVTDAFSGFLTRLDDFEPTQYQESVENYANKKALDFGKKIMKSYKAINLNIEMLETTLMTEEALSNPTNLKDKLDIVKNDLIKSGVNDFVKNLESVDFKNQTEAKVLEELSNDPNNPLQKIVDFAKTWVLDRYDSFTEGDVTNAGRIQQNITTAITAGQSLNDAQKEEVRRFMFVFEEYYKSAAAMLSKITQLIEKIAQNINR